MWDLGCFQLYETFIASFGRFRYVGPCRLRYGTLVAFAIEP